MGKKESIKKPIYKKWWVWVIVVIILFAIFIGGDDETEVGEQPEKETVTPSEPATEEVKVVTQEEFEAYAQNITGGTFIKTISITDNKGSIKYYGSYEEYKQGNPDNLLKEEDYKNYFETGDAVEKILVSENVRLLRQFPDLTATSMVLPYDGKKYSIDLDRQEVNEYLGLKVEELISSDGSWNEKFNHPVVYDDTNRKKFFDTFVKVQ